MQVEQQREDNVTCSRSVAFSPAGYYFGCVRTAVLDEARSRSFLGITAAF